LSYTKLTRERARRQRIAQDIPEGSYVNLGIGMPTLSGTICRKTARFPAQRERHPRNGAGAGSGLEDMDLINAGKEPVTLLTGGAYFHHTDSFAMMRRRACWTSPCSERSSFRLGRLAKLVHRRRRDPRRGRRDGPRGRAKNVGDDGASHEERGIEDRVRCTYPLTASAS